MNALITGASSGIGLELSRLFARKGHDLVLVARREDALRALAEEIGGRTGRRCVVMAADLTRPAAGLDLARRVSEAGLEIDFLVNNAGFGLFGPFLSTELERELEMLQLNVIALTEITKRFLPPMVSRGRGWILNVASTAAFQPGPFLAVYFASKAYVLSFSEALANELGGTNVRVTALCPGPTRSEFQATARLTDSKMVHGKLLPDAASVARCGYDAMMKGKRVAIPGLRNQALANLVRFLPRDLVTAIVRRMQERVQR